MNNVLALAVEFISVCDWFSFDSMNNKLREGKLEREWESTVKYIVEKVLEKTVIFNWMTGLPLYVRDSVWLSERLSELERECLILIDCRDVEYFRSSSDVCGLVPTPFIYYYSRAEFDWPSLRVALFLPFLRSPLSYRRSLLGWEMLQISGVRTVWAPRKIRRKWESNAEQSLMDTCWLTVMAILCSFLALTCHIMS